MALQSSAVAMTVTIPMTVTVALCRSRGPETLKVYLERLDAEAVLDRLLRKLSPRETEVVRIGLDSLFFSERLSWGAGDWDTNVTWAMLTL